MRPAGPMTSESRPEGVGEFHIILISSESHTCFQLGAPSSPTESVRLTGGEDLPHSNCFLHLFSDSACRKPAGTIGPLAQEGGHPVSTLMTSDHQKMS